MRNCSSVAQNHVITVTTGNRVGAAATNDDIDACTGCDRIAARITRRAGRWRTVQIRGRGRAEAHPHHIHNTTITDDAVDALTQVGHIRSPAKDDDVVAF